MKTIRLPAQPRLDLNLLATFAAIVESPNMTAAAHRLGVAKAKVSTDLLKLEKQLGQALITRNTRSLSLTDAGRSVYAEAVPLVRQAIVSVERATSSASSLRGRLRVTSTIDHCADFLAPALAEFAALHDGLNIYLHAAEDVVDLLGGGFDLAIRGGQLPSSGLRATRLGEFQLHVLGSPAYLRRAGRPLHPADLQRFNWIQFSNTHQPSTLEFRHIHTLETAMVHIESRLRVNTGPSLRGMLLAGGGLSALVGDVPVAQAISDGRLEPVLAQWRLPPKPIQAVFPHQTEPSPTVRAFIEFYRRFISAHAVLGGEPAAGLSAG